MFSKCNKLTITTLENCTEQYNSIEALTIHNHQEAVQKLFEVAGEKTSLAHVRYYKNI
jgi:quinol monooxygenase YgiN